MSGVGPRAGALVANRFELIRELGRGGTSSVWLAVHAVTKKRVALKFLTSVCATQRARLLREARAACRAPHAHICEVHDVLEDADGPPVLVLDYLEGESLARRLERVGRLDVAVTATLLAQAASALGAAHHAGVVHRDVKPHNLFVREDGALVVLDFGIAKLRDGEDGASLTETGATPGTPAYMAPEQVFGERSADHRCDVWALGIVLYQCLSGASPTAAENSGQVLKRVVEGNFRRLRELGHEVPADIDDLVMRMLARDPKDRPEDMREVLDVLLRHTDVEVPGVLAPRALSESDAPVRDDAGSSTMETGVLTLQGTATDRGSRLSPAEKDGQLAEVRAEWDSPQTSRVGGGGRLVALAMAVCVLVGAVWWVRGERGETTGASASTPALASSSSSSPSSSSSTSTSSAASSSSLSSSSSASAPSVVAPSISMSVSARSPARATAPRRKRGDPLRDRF